ncbi:MAG: divergent PAP2 family protein [Actinomycetia bacterium]|nr:divergent PAP2 family protein [Actinomycetes bacterium]
MDVAYPIVPFAAWVVAGSAKFAINSIKAGEPAFGQIGYGGLPSNHSAIVSSVAALIALREGLDHPALGVAVALAFIVILDASTLRRHVGRHAEAINRLANWNAEADGRPLRERMGHTRIEIAAGIVVGIGVALIVDLLGDLL